MSLTINNLFTNYQAAFDKSDAVSIAGHYRLRCAITDADGAKVFRSAQALIDKLEHNCETMKSMGYAGSEFNILTQLGLGAIGKAVNIGWRVELEGRAMDFRCLYICHRVDKQWKIYAAKVYQGSYK